MADAELIAAARAAAANAYAPYSRFAVGAALRLTDGAIVTGANLENASYGLSLCAEAAALAAANSAGRLRDVVAVAVVGGSVATGTMRGTEVVRPCGRCRQLLAEAAQLGGRDIPVHSAAAEGGAVESRLVSALIPDAFGPADLGLA